MVIVDSADSILMLYSYAGFVDQNKWALIKRDIHPSSSVGTVQHEHEEEMKAPSDHKSIPGKGKPTQNTPIGVLERSPDNWLYTSEGVSQIQNIPTPESIYEKSAPDTEDVPVSGSTALELTRRAKLNTMSHLSIVMTLISILVALRCDTIFPTASNSNRNRSLDGSISLITIMGLVGGQCGPCQEAANAPNGGGLAGRWWRGWAKVRQSSSLALPV